MASKAKNEKRSAASVFKAIDDLLRTPGGHCQTAIDYMEQTSWLLFLRYLDAREEERRDEAELRGEPYQPALPKKFAWSTWAYPLDKDGKFDHEKALNGDDLLKFVKEDLFPGLRALRDTAATTQSIQYRIGGIFAGLKCLFESGHTLRDVIDLIQPLSFQTEEDRHELTVLYEERLGEMGNAGLNGGQYYTPRPLIRVMVRILDPKLGEKFFDGACGSAGFICEGFTYMRDRTGNKPGAWDILQKETFYGQEVMSIPYATAQMNCILHGLETPNIVYGDTLKIKIADFTDEDRVDVIAANPPFGAKVEASAKANFVTRSSESAYLFMEHFIERLRDGGRAAIIIKNTVLSNSDKASTYIRKMLIEKCELQMILDLPQKVFTIGEHTVVLFFKKGKPTTKPIKYYELDLGGVSLGKTRPLKEEDLLEFEAVATGRINGDGLKSYWTVDPKSVNRETYDLRVKNPNVPVENIRKSFVIRNSLLKTFGNAENFIDLIRSEHLGVNRHSPWALERLGDICEVRAGATHHGIEDVNGPYPVYGSGGYICQAKKFRCPANSVTIGRKGTLDKPLLIKEPFWNIDTCFGVIPGDRVLAEYLWRYCQTVDFYSLIPSSGRPSTNSDAIKDLKIPLPSLEIQRRIIDQLDQRIGVVAQFLKSIDQLITLSSELRKSILTEAFA